MELGNNPTADHHIDAGEELEVVEPRWGHNSSNKYFGKTMTNEHNIIGVQWFNIS